jgi:hypothetical protein
LSPIWKWERPSLRTLAKPGIACRSPGLMKGRQCAAILLKKENIPENARGSKGDGQEAVSSISGKDELLGFCLGFVVSIERLFRKRYALVDIDEILAIEDHTSRAGVNEFWNIVFLGGTNDSLGTVYVDLPVEGWVLKASSW